MGCCYNSVVIYLCFINDYFKFVVLFYLRYCVYYLLIVSGFGIVLWLFCLIVCFGVCIWIGICFVVIVVWVCVYCWLFSVAVGINGWFWCLMIWGIICCGFGCWFWVVMVYGTLLLFDGCFNCLLVCVLMFCLGFRWSYFVLVLLVMVCLLLCLFVWMFVWVWILLLVWFWWLLSIVCCLDFGVPDALCWVCFIWLLLCGLVGLGWCWCLFVCFVVIWFILI